MFVTDKEFDELLNIEAAKDLFRSRQYKLWLNTKRRFAEEFKSNRHFEKYAFVFYAMAFRDQVEPKVVKKKSVKNPKKS